MKIKVVSLDRLTPSKKRKIIDIGVSLADIKVLSSTLNKAKVKPIEQNMINKYTFSLEQINSLVAIGVFYIDLDLE